MEALVTGYGLIEGPVWDDARGLIFSDVVNGGCGRCPRTGGWKTSFPSAGGSAGWPCTPKADWCSAAAT